MDAMVDDEFANYPGVRVGYIRAVVPECRSLKSNPNWRVKLGGEIGQHLNIHGSVETHPLFRNSYSFIVYSEMTQSKCGNTLFDSSWWRTLRQFTFHQVVNANFNPRD
jgi:hypothetical protein